MKPLPLILGLTILALTSTIDLRGQSRPAGAADGQHESGQMMAQHHTMMAEMQASQKKLDELVAQMNKATGAAKVDRIAALLTELVAQHARMGTMMQSREMPMMKPNAVTAPSTPPAAGAKPEDHGEHHK